MKSTRQKIILNIISREDIETQGQLIDALEAAGVKSTQATISRDIKDLRLIKELSPRGTYRYVAPNSAIVSSHADKLIMIFRESVTSYQCAQNIVVIKTLPGLAPAACSAIDKMEVTSLVGTLAGDDTAFLAMADSEAARRFCEVIQEYIKK